jgi:alcohol dehydrogenase class IV
LIAPLQARLQAGGVDVSIYDGVEPDPTIAQIEAGVTRLKQHGSKAVLAVGGGSSIDAAKIIATRATNSRSVEEMMGIMKVPNAPLPLYALPTTAGTGSEVTIGAVISDLALQRKIPVIDPKLNPRMLALDGALMTGLPPSVTAATGMDALTHAIEAYLSNIATTESDQAALEATRLIMQYLPQVMLKGDDVHARQMMVWAAYRAGLAINIAGIGYVHAIAHNFGGLYHTPHGVANAIVLPHLLEHMQAACIERLATLARVSGLQAANDRALAELFIAHIRQLNKQFGIPKTLTALRRQDFPKIIEAAMQEAHSTYAVPRYMDKPEMQQVLEKMLP